MEAAWAGPSHQEKHDEIRAKSFDANDSCVSVDLAPRRNPAALGSHRMGAGRERLHRRPAGPHQTSNVAGSTGPIGGSARQARSIYKDIHANPELAMQEHRTAGIAADWLRKHGYEVTEKIGGTGVVGLLRNGEGATVLLRADMDALPMKENTGLPYASKKTRQGHSPARRPPSRTPAGTTCMLPG